MVIRNHPDPNYRGCQAGEDLAGVLHGLQADLNLYEAVARELTYRAEWGIRGDKGSPAGTFRNHPRAKLVESLRTLEAMVVTRLELLKGHRIQVMQQLDAFNNFDDAGDYIGPEE